MYITKKHLSKGFIMKLPDKVSENIIYEEKINKIAFTWPLCGTLFFFLVLFLNNPFFTWLKDNNCSSDSQALFFCIFLLILLALSISSIYGFIIAATRKIIITEKAVIAHWGLIGKSSSTIFLNKIQSVNCHQGIYGRIFNCGQICITGTGGESEEFEDIEFFKEFQDILHYYIEQAKTKQ